MRYKEDRIGGTHWAMKLLKASCCGGNRPFTIGVSAMSDFIDEPALVMYLPVERRKSTSWLPPSNHQSPVLGSL